MLYRKEVKKKKKALELGVTPDLYVSAVFYYTEQTEFTSKTLNPAIRPPLPNFLVSKKIEKYIEDYKNLVGAKLVDDEELDTDLYDTIQLHVAALKREIEIHKNVGSPLSEDLLCCDDVLFHANPIIRILAFPESEEVKKQYLDKAIEQLDNNHELKLTLKKYDKLKLFSTTD